MELKINDNIKAIAEHLNMLREQAAKVTIPANFAHDSSYHGSVVLLKLNSSREPNSYKELSEKITELIETELQLRCEEKLRQAAKERKYCLFPRWETYRTYSELRLVEVSGTDYELAVEVLEKLRPAMEVVVGQLNQVYTDRYEAYRVHFRDHLVAAPLKQSRRRSCRIVHSLISATIWSRPHSAGNGPISPRRAACRSNQQANPTEAEIRYYDWNCRINRW
jgi:hypothetical protein